MKINSSEVTVVIHGPTESNSDILLSKETIDSVRAILPDAEIIFSTWINGGLCDLNVRLVESIDPGNYIDINGRPVNINRQIVAINAGLNLAGRPYVLKIRHDTPLINETIISFPPVVESSGKLNIFKNKILIPNVCVRSPIRMMQLFSICDLVQFGRIDDIRKLWNLPLVVKEDHQSDEARRCLINRSMGPTGQKFVAEQYNLLHLLGLVGQFNCPWSANYKLIDTCFKVWKANFLIIDFNEVGIKFPYRVLNPKYVRDTFTSQSEIESYCGMRECERSKFARIGLLRVKFPLFNNKAGYVAIAANVLSRLPKNIFNPIRTWYRKKFLRTV